VELTRRSKTGSKKKNRKVAFLKGSKAFYRGPKGIEKVTVVGVHHDSKLEPYYTIKFRDGKEKQMDGKCLTAIEERGEAPKPAAEERVYCSNEDPTDQCSTSSSEEEGVEEEEFEDDRFHQGQDAYYRSPSGEGVTKIKVVDKASPSRYVVSLQDGTKKQVDGAHLVGLIDLTSKELASLMKEKNERHAERHAERAERRESQRMGIQRGDSSESDNDGNGDEKALGETAPRSNVRSIRRQSSHGGSTLRSSQQSKGSLPTLDQGYEPETDPTSSENSYETDMLHTPSYNNGDKEVLALPCAVEMVEAKTEDGGSKIVPLYKAEMDVYYRGPQGIEIAHILSTHLDDLLEPYYTIRLEDGREKQTDNAHISLEKPVVEEEEKDEGGELNAEDDDDWYQEWKANQLKEEEEWRQKQKEAEEEFAKKEKQGSEEKQPAAEEKQPAEKEKQTLETKEEHRKQPASTTLTPEKPIATAPTDEKPAAQERRSSGKEDTDPDPTLGALVPKQHADSPETTPRAKKEDPAETGSIVQAPQFSVGDDVLYNSSKGDHCRGTVLKLRRDEKHRPYYVIKLSNGQEKKVYGHRLTPVRREAKMERRRSRSKSVSRREREPAEQISKRSASVDCRRYSRRPSIDSRQSRDESLAARSRNRNRINASGDPLRTSDRARSSSRPPTEEVERSRGRRSESRDPRGRVHPTDSKESRSRSKSVRAPRDDSSRDGERRSRDRSRSRAPGESSVKKSVTRRAPGTMGVSHRVQHIGDDEGSTARSRGGSRFSKMRNSLTSSISKAKQRSFDKA
jgi:hypothetical protein